MYININVVVALMRLRSISPEILGGLLHVPQESILHWLVDGKDDAVLFETQLEALRLLGINNDRPRADVVHYWKVQEPFFGSPHDIYSDLNTLVETFGVAQVVHIASASDPLLTTAAKAHFGLRFNGFYAMLEVTGHPLRPLRFNPAKLSGLEWVEGVQCVMLEADEYLKLEPGAMRVGGIQQHLAYNENKSAWDELQSLAAKRSLSPQAIAAFVDVVNTLQLGHEPNTEGRTDALAAILAQRMNGASTYAAVTPAASPRIEPVMTPTKPADGDVQDVISTVVKVAPTQQELDEILFATPVQAGR